MEEAAKWDEVKFDGLIEEILIKIQNTPTDELGSTVNEKIARVFEDVLSDSDVISYQVKTYQGYTPEKQRARLERLFHLNVIPSIPEEEVEIGNIKFEPSTFRYVLLQTNKLKKELLAESLPPEITPTLESQIQKYPIMRAAIEEIKLNLDRYDDYTLADERAARRDLKETLAQQFLNLAELSDIIIELSKDQVNDIALATLSPYDLTSEKEFQTLLVYSLSGNTELTDPDEKDFLKNAIRLTLEKKKAASTFSNATEEVLKKNEGSRVTPKAIRLQAKLFHAIREGREWASAQSKLAPLGTSVNNVYKLNEPEKDTVAAYFKMGGCGEESTGGMEKLAWDIAVVMGLEDQFVPTGLTEIIYYSDASENETNPTPKKLRGGIQPAEMGELLHSFKKGKDAAKLSRKEVARATLATLLFGMFDAHANNIMVVDETDSEGQKDKKLKFFDNSRSLPGTNGFILRKDQIKYSYRNALLDLPQSAQNLTSKEIEDLVTEVASYREKLDPLKEYLKSSHAKAQIKNLPPGWMDTDRVIAAMEERIQNLENVLANGKINTLQDLVAMSQPSYPFAYALTYLSSLQKGKTYDAEKLHAFVNTSDFQKTINQAKDLGIDIGLIKIWSETPPLSFAALAKKVEAHFDETLFLPPTGTELKRRQMECDNLINEILKNGVIDCKDSPRNESEHYIRIHNIKAFQKEIGQTLNELLNVVTIRNTILTASMKGQNIRLAKEKNEFNKIVYNTPTGYRVKKIDLKSFQDQVVADGKKMTMRELIDSLGNVTEPPAYDELPFITPHIIETLFNSPNREREGIFLSKGTDRKSLVVSSRAENGKIVQDTYPPGQEGKFIVDSEELSIDEIIDVINIYKGNY